MSFQRSYEFFELIYHIFTILISHTCYAYVAAHGHLGGGGWLFLIGKGG